MSVLPIRSISRVISASRFCATLRFLSWITQIWPSRSTCSLVSSKASLTVSRSDIKVAASIRVLSTTRCLPAASAARCRARSWCCRSRSCKAPKSSLHCSTSCFASSRHTRASSLSARTFSSCPDRSFQVRSSPRLWPSSSEHAELLSTSSSRTSFSKSRILASFARNAELCSARLYSSSCCCSATAARSTVASACRFSICSSRSLSRTSLSLSRKSR
mmetsp:Transcript_29735/g.58161  ORF Transcript_29735/g.58161 Transcript_29735/m.58161 type:complete len:218 (+) Transcript_29735:369-1022(+)